MFLNIINFKKQILYAKKYKSILKLQNTVRWYRHFPARKGAKRAAKLAGFFRCRAHNGWATPQGGLIALHLKNSAVHLLSFFPFFLLENV